jgi:threonine/homoserine/homoserine lactone efflux protein
VPPDRPLFATTAVLGLVQVSVELCVYGVLALGVARAGGWFRTSVVRRRLEATTGTVLVALGFRLALSDR